MLITAWPEVVVVNPWLIVAVSSGMIIPSPVVSLVIRTETVEGDPLKLLSLIWIDLIVAKKCLELEYETLILLFFDTSYVVPIPVHPSEMNLVIVDIFDPMKKG